MQPTPLQDLSRMGIPRPVFHAELGAELAKLREKDMGWTQEQVVRFAKQKGLEVGMGALKSLEAGKTKFPDADILKALSTLYEVPYEDLVLKFVRANYGGDLIRHAADQHSGSPQRAGAPLNETTAADRRELVRLRALREKNEKENGKVRTLVTALFEVAVDLRKAANSTKQRTGGGRRHREAG